MKWAQIVLQKSHRYVKKTKKQPGYKQSVLSVDLVLSREGGL